MSTSSFSSPAIALCLATYNPPLPLFRRQIQSLRAQQYPHWHCFISDDGSAPEFVREMQTMLAADERFTVSPAPVRQGFYRNFERCLRLVPATFPYVAFADQDDHWYPEKLSVLAAEINEPVVLAYSDARIVDGTGAVLAETYWQGRQPNRGDLASLALTNSVTGAAALFSSSLLPYVLPFPAEAGNLAHDHWLACVALSVGQIRYVDRCLYDYVQHGANAIGHGETKAPFLPKFIVLSLLNLARRKGWQQAEIIYRQEVRKIVVVAQTILQRCQPLLSAEARATWQRLAQLDQSFSSFWWLLQRGRHTAPLTAGAEYHLALGLLWHSLSKHLFRGISQ